MKEVHTARRSPTQTQASVSIFLIAITALCFAVFAVWLVNNETPDAATIVTLPVLRCINAISVPTANAATELSGIVIVKFVAELQTINSFASCKAN